MNHPMKAKFQRVSFALLVLLCTWQVARAVPEETESLAVPSPATPAMQAALTQSSAEHSDAPLETLLASVPKSEQATLALNLFLAITADVEARRRVGTIILLMPLSAEGISRKHVLLLTRAYLHTVEHPLKGPNRGLDSGRTFDDQVFQSKVRRFLSGYLGTHAYPPLMAPATPLERLKQVFDEAEKTQAGKEHPDPAALARIQACRDLLPQ